MTNTWYRIQRFNFGGIEIDEFEVEKETEKFVYTKSPHGSIRRKKDAYHFAIRKTRIECLQWLRAIRRSVMERSEKAMAEANDDLEQVELALEYELRNPGGEPEMFAA